MKNSLIKKKVVWKDKKNISWLNKKTRGTIIIDWGNVVRVCWNDNTCTDTQLNLLKIL